MWRPTTSRVYWTTQISPDSLYPVRWGSYLKRAEEVARLASRLAAEARERAWGRRRYIMLAFKKGKSFVDSDDSDDSGASKRGPWG